MAAPAAPSPVARLRALSATRTGRALSFGVLASLTLLGCALVARQARVAVARMPAYRLGPESVRFVDLPAHVDERMAGALRDGLAAAWPAETWRRPCTFDPALDRRLRELLAAHPMIREVLDVDVRFPAEVRVRATVRLPLARFQARWPDPRRPGGSTTVVLPVDAEGVVLAPDTYAGFLAAHQAVLVTGVEAVCPGIGRRFTDTKEQVAEGLAAARVANRLNQDLLGLATPRVESVDVAGFPATPRSRMKGEVVLLLSDGRTVQWGRTERAASEVTREDPFDVKRDRLLDLLATRPVADRRPLDVRFPPGQRDMGAGPLAPAPGRADG